jgi:hypothetical protein
MEASMQPHIKLLPKCYHRVCPDLTCRSPRRSGKLLENFWGVNQSCRCTVRHFRLKRCGNARAFRRSDSFVDAILACALIDGVDHHKDVDDAHTKRVQ